VLFCKRRKNKKKQAVKGQVVKEKDEEKNEKNSGKVFLEWDRDLCKQNKLLQLFHLVLLLLLEINMQESTIQTLFSHFTSTKIKNPNKNS
jgi:hypothetical protein